MKQIASWVPDSAFREGTPGILFKIGTYEFHAYSLTMLLGMIAAILTISIFWQREKYKWDHLLTLVLITIPSSLIGSRLLFLIENIPNKSFDWSSWYAIWQGGLSIQGGVALAFLLDLMYVYSKRDLLDIRKVASIIIPTILIGQVIGRWGNFANHEVYGKVDWSGHSVLIFGHHFASQMYISDSVSNYYNQVGLYRYPLFLYEGLANLIGYIILVWIINQFGLLKPGSSAALYFVYYGIVRFAMEPLREEHFLLYSVIAALFIIMGSLAFIYFQFLCKIHYLKKWRKNRFVYAYAHPEKYIIWIEKTRFFRTKRTKEGIKELVG